MKSPFYSLIFLCFNIIYFNLAFSQVDLPEFEKPGRVSPRKDIVESSSFEFLKFEEKENSKIVYFSIKGITDEVHKKSISNKMLNDENIINFIIDNHNMCKVTINNKVNADYIRNILISEGVDYNYKTVKTVKKEKKDTVIRKKSSEHFFKK